jgi:hypothetical protein
MRSRSILTGSEVHTRKDEYVLWLALCVRHSLGCNELIDAAEWFVSTVRTAGKPDRLSYDAALVKRALPPASDNRKQDTRLNRVRLGTFFATYNITSQHTNIDPRLYVDAS